IFESSPPVSADSNSTSAARYFSLSFSSGTAAAEAPAANFCNPCSCSFVADNSLNVDSASPLNRKFPPDSPPPPPTTRPTTATTPPPRCCPPPPPPPPPHPPPAPTPPPRPSPPPPPPPPPQKQVFRQKLRPPQPPHEHVVPPTPPPKPPHLLPRHHPIHLRR